MAYLNKVNLIGNMGKDPEIRVTQNGKKCAKFSLATSERFKDRNTGESRDSTEWHNVVAWGQVAEIIERLDIKKGTSLYVEGKLTYRSWDDQSGQKKYITEIVIDRLQVLTPRQSSGVSADCPDSQTQADNANPDDLPF